MYNLENECGYLRPSDRHNLRHRSAGGQVEGGGGDGGGGGDRLGVVIGDRRRHDGGAAHAQLYVDGRLGLRLRADEAQAVHTLHPVHPLGQGQSGAFVLVPLEEGIVNSLSSLPWHQGSCRTTMENILQNLFPK